jgi:hypothetical protein
MSHAADHILILSHSTELNSVLWAIAQNIAF